MAQIQKLSENLINHIAAGEVVERPASIVRELVDNSLDAGATNITVILEEGGIRLIKITDDGSGMSADDACLCLERHATSKLKTVDDLQSINTLGFRGEALASIAAVSRMTVSTKARANTTARTTQEMADQEIGYQVDIAGGEISLSQPAPCNFGTEISVRDLFFNTPARKKFLRQPATEQDKVKKWLQPFSIAWPQVRFKLIADGKELCNLAPVGTPIERAKQLMRGVGVEVSECIAVPSGEVKCSGYMGHPRHVQGSFPGVAILINSRLVNDRILLRAVKDGFSSMLGGGETPLGFISVQLPPELVDVNVHPQKSEVRFRDSQAMYQFVRRAVENGVRKIQAPREMPGKGGDLNQARSGAPGSQIPSHWKGSQNWSKGGSTSQSATYNTNQQALFSTAVGESAGLQYAAAGTLPFSELRYLGEALGCYLVCEGSGQIIVVDMHAAHERVNFNKIRARYQEGEIASQGFLTPVVVELGALERQLILKEEPLFAKFGFHLEDYGSGERDAAILIRAAPPELSPAKIDQMLREILSGFNELDGDSIDPSGAIERQIDMICARLACHASIRSGRELKREEVYQLFAELDKAETSGACPHGRPISIAIGESDLERLFSR